MDFIIKEYDHFTYYTFNSPHVVSFLDENNPTEIILDQFFKNPGSSVTGKSELLKALISLKTLLPKKRTIKLTAVPMKTTLVPHVNQEKLNLYYTSLGFEKKEDDNFEANIDELIGRMKGGRKRKTKRKTKRKYTN